MVEEKRRRGEEKSPGLRRGRYRKEPKEEGSSNVSGCISACRMRQLNIYRYLVPVIKIGNSREPGKCGLKSDPCEEIVLALPYI